MKWATILVIVIAIVASALAALLYAVGDSAAKRSPAREDHDYVYSTYMS